MSRMRPEVMREFLRLPLVGVLATLRADGRPYTVPVGWLHDGDDCVPPSPRDGDAVARFFANMQTEPRLLFELVPSVWRAIDLTVYRGKRADREFQERPRAGS
jgi:nitroimidazol reductase NimA-like FMN-containing flavoprotein (pyridoxamine 5'-phosphate oxidase superfamily)